MGDHLFETLFFRLAKGGKAQKKRKLEYVNCQNKIPRLDSTENYETELGAFAEDTIKRAAEKKIPIESLIKCINNTLASCNAAFDKNDSKS